MITALIAAIVLTSLAFLVMLDRRDKRSAAAIGELTALIEREAKAYREAQQQATAAFLGALERERDAKRDELQTLCQRIQAPEVAVVQHQQQTLPVDESPWPLSERESVEAQEERMAAIAAIERMEREGLGVGFGSE